MNLKSSYLCFIAAAFFLLLSACAPVEKIKTPVIEIKKVEIPEEIVVREKPELSVAVLLSSSAKTFKSMSEILVNKLNKKTKVYVLTGENINDVELIKTIQLSNHTHVVALGLNAAKAVAPLKDKLVVFSHVFNYKDYHLSNKRMKGVSALPVPDQLFKDWKALFPELSSVVLVTGVNLESYAKYAKGMAKKHGVDLVHRIAKNDKEFIYITKRLPLDVQGQWILPDSRILSRTAIKEVMSYNSKKGKQSVVFSKGLLSLGGLFYVSASDLEVANLIMKRLNESLGEKNIPGEDVLRTKKHDMGINKKVAGQLGLIIPEHYRKYIRD